MAAVAQVAGNRLPLDDDITNFTAFHVVEEVGEGQFVLHGPLRRTLEQIEQGKNQQGDDDPEGEIPAEIQRLSPFKRLDEGRRDDVSTPHAAPTGPFFQR